MLRHYANYRWIDGKPVGITPVSKEHSLSFRIVTDPYHKRYTLEKYDHGIFHQLVYDSILLDFRKIHPQYQSGWQREVLTDHHEFQKCLIRDIEDRIILCEELSFEDGHCRICKLSSPHGIPLASQKIYYQEKGDPWNGVVLLDILEKPVMHKKYSLGGDKEFHEVLEECWKI